MKFLIVSLALVAAVAADVSHLVARTGEAGAAIVRSDSDVRADGYQYAFETENGISGQEQGVIKAVGQDLVNSVSGQNSYTSPEGLRFETTYVADENGYQPQGAHLPTPPPTPEHVLRLVEYIKTHPSQEVVKTYQAVPQTYQAVPQAYKPRRY